MNPINHRSKLLLLLLALLIAVPSFGIVSRPRRRATNPIPLPVLDSNFNGHLSDVTNGMPVASADIVVEGVAITASDKNGDFKLLTSNGRHFILTAQRSGYLPVSTELTGVTGTQSFSLKMQPTQVLTLRDTDGVVHSIDIENAQFAYLIPFSGYARSDNGNFCKADGSALTPAKSEIRRIVGPGKPVNQGACCVGAPRGQVLQANIELRSGETDTVIFTDSCSGNEVDFIGRDHVSGDFSYYNFAKIAEIVFP
jgi:hypothetical protein